MIGELVLPSGRVIRGRSVRVEPDTAADFTLFCLGKTPPPVAHDQRWIKWRDFWLPADRGFAAACFAEAWARAAGDLVEVVCGGGQGRTGTALACIAIIDGVPAEKAVDYVRTHYSRHAVETPWQRRYVRGFGR
jgi:hypothetical protein